MIAYVDSSVVLRIVLGQPDPLPEWSRLERAISSELLRVECLRTIDRLRIRAGLDDRTVADRRGALLETIEAIDLVALDASILSRAAEPFPTLVRTLDALHLASALAIREELPSLVFFTHDVTLGLAAAATGFDVWGLGSG